MGVTPRRQPGWQEQVCMISLLSCLLKSYQPLLLHCWLYVERHIGICRKINRQFIPAAEDHRSFSNTIPCRHPDRLSKDNSGMTHSYLSVFLSVGGNKDNMWHFGGNHMAELENSDIISWSKPASVCTAAKLFSSISSICNHLTFQHNLGKHSIVLSDWLEFFFSL